MADPDSSAQEINFEGDQERFERHHQDEREHLFKAIVHHAGLGPNPGHYKGPGPEEPEPTDDVSERLAQEYRLHEDPESALAAERMREIGPAKEFPPQGGPPPQESVEQPEKPKEKKPGKPPSGTTPAALGQQAVQPQPPQGDF